MGGMSAGKGGQTWQTDWLKKAKGDARVAVNMVAAHWYNWGLSREEANEIISREVGWLSKNTAW